MGDTAHTIRDQMRRARALQEHINRLGAGPPDPCAKLRAAARAVVERWEELTYELPGRIDDPINDRMDALREALEQARAD